jgi:hypothetical protein
MCTISPSHETSLLEHLYEYAVGGERGESEDERERRKERGERGERR